MDGHDGVCTLQYESHSTTIAAIQQPLTHGLAPYSSDPGASIKSFNGKSCRLTPAALLILALHVPGAHAEEAVTPRLSFAGFGTLGVVHSSENKADFGATVLVPNGAGYSHPWSADVDSRIGAQVAANFTPQLSAVVQVISEQRYDNSYTPTIEWANVKYHFTPDFSVRVGRIVLPVFLVSDYRKLSYANPWVRPPVELYSLIPVSSSDGIDASYRVQRGELTNTVQATHGYNKAQLPGGGTVSAKDTWGVSYTAEYGATAVHATYHRTKMTLDSVKPLFDGFRQFGAQGVALAEKYDVNNKPHTFIGIGARYDPGRWFVMGEWGLTQSDSALGKRSAWYASGGYRLGPFTPYLTYAQAKVQSNMSDPGLTVSALPPFLAGPAVGLNAGLNALLGSAPIQKTLSVGMRWDFARNTALKLQFDHIRIGAGSQGTLINIQPGFQPGGKVNVFSATLDFVF
ncbi:MAG: hypothetical protein Q8K50_07985 [Hydrogenophaga sp.]|nr:hypothetical protein [Hydrogenophaga sp.]